MTMKTEIIEAVADALDAVDRDWVEASYKEMATAALNTALPYIKKQLVAELEAEGYRLREPMTPDEVDLIEELVGIIERFEL